MAASGIEQAYRTGRGPVLVRGRAFIEDESSGSSAPGNGKRAVKRAAGSRTIIVITELPYQTNKADLVARVARLVDSGALQGKPLIRYGVQSKCNRVHLLTHAASRLRLVRPVPGQCSVSIDCASATFFYICFLQLVCQLHQTHVNQVGS